MTPQVSMKLEEITFSEQPKTENHPEIDSKLSLSQEQFKLGLPADGQVDQSYGILLYLSPTDDGTPPNDWLPVLAERKLLVLGPMRVGNRQDPRRRMGVGLLGALALQQKYQLDPKRVYAAGTSGGARVASALAFFRPDVFSGTIQSVGSNFPRPIPQPKGGEGYGLMSGEQLVDRAAVKASVRFVLITSPTDFRHDNLQAIYRRGFLADGYQVKFLDVPGLGHQTCGPRQLQEALDFIEAR